MLFFCFFRVFLVSQILETLSMRLELVDDPLLLRISAMTTGGKPQVWWLVWVLLLFAVFVFSAVVAAVCGCGFAFGCYFHVFFCPGLVGDVGIFVVVVVAVNAWTRLVRTLRVYRAHGFMSR